MTWKIGDKFKFKRPKNLLEFTAEIIGIYNGEFVQFKIIECNQKHLIGKEKFFKIGQEAERSIKRICD